MGADLYFTALVGERLTVVSERGERRREKEREGGEREYCCSATSKRPQRVTAVYWTLTLHCLQVRVFVPG